MVGNFATIEAAAGRAPGLSYLNTYRSVPAESTYLGFGDLANFDGIPLPEDVVPGFTEFTLYDRQQNIASFASSYQHPYVQNITFAATRNVTSSLVVDLRYIGTLTRKNFSSLNLNMPNFTTNGLLEAFDAARRGENPPLLDDLMAGLLLGGGVTTPIGDTQPAGDALRRSAGRASLLPAFSPGWFQSFNTMLANGDYDGLANALNVLSLPGGQPGEYMEINGFPVNFIKASPQFNDATYYTNQGHSNYHSFQAQVTLRPRSGLNFQSTYTWSRNLGISPSGTVTNPEDIWMDYTLLPSHRKHNWVTYGGYELPFGPGRQFGGETTGIVARLIEGWQTSWIFNVTSGSPLSITANNTLYANGVPDMVNEGFDFDSVGVYWPDGAGAGNYFGNRYDQVRDPVCSDSSIIDPSIQGRCTLNAVRNIESGNVVLQNAMPGHQGNFGLNRLTNITRWTLDMSFSKSVQLTESKSFRIRVDASNILNHPFASGTLGSTGTRIVFPTPPSVSLTGGTFGAFEYKVGGRTFQMMARFDF